MTTSVLLDTSFLITLFKKSRANHETAVLYYRYLLQHNIPIHFSAIVAAEFGIKQSIADLPLGNFRVLNFNVPHGNCWFKELRTVTKTIQSSLYINGVIIDISN